MKVRPFEAVEHDREKLLKTIAELRAGKLRGIAVAEVPQLIFDLKKRIASLSRELGEDPT